MPRSTTTAEYTIAEPDDAFDSPFSAPAQEDEGGWGAFNKIKSSGFLDRFTPTNEIKLIKLLDDAPVKAYRQHWVNNSPLAKKSFVCEGRGNCPLCDKVGDKPQVRVLFNVVDLSGNAPEVKTWTVGSMLTEILSNMAQNKATSPLNRTDLYWAVSSSGGGTKGKISYNVNPVKARDLVEDYQTEPLTAKQLESFVEVRADASSVRRSTQDELNQVADHILATQ